MKYDPQKHHRRSIRLKGYDYTSPGAYFIAICTHQRHCLFGEIINGEMQLNAMGQCVDAHWNRLATHFPHLQLDGFVVMPNHIHGILILTPTENPTPRMGAALGNPRSHSTGTFCPNATPGSDSVKPQPETVSPDWNQGSIALPLESEPGVTFGREMGADGVGGLPNVAPLRAGSLGAIVLNFKSVTTRRINQMRKMTSVPVWQRNYYERIIRDDQALEQIRAYIHNNPRSW
jgi:putative transposase